MAAQRDNSPADHKRSYSELRLAEIPDLELQFTRLAREVAVGETVLQFLTKEYESARIQEDGETTYISVLSHAEAPLFRSSPKRLKYLMLGMILGLLIGGAWTWLTEANVQLRSKDPARLAQLQKDLGPLGWVLRIG